MRKLIGATILSDRLSLSVLLGSSRNASQCGEALRDAAKETMALQDNRNSPFRIRACRSRIRPSRLFTLPEVNPVLFMTLFPLYQSCSYK